MAHVQVNNEDCTVQVKGDFVVFLHSSVAKDPIHVGARTVTQLLRSRKDDTAAKIVADGVPYVLKFATLQDRESLIESIVRIQEAPPDHQSNDDWVASSICHAAVDVGVLDEGELKAILSADGQRGVEQAFEALEGLVDRSSFELLPITEQMENDVLRQIPALAAIFQNRVVDKETKKAFWEAVVRKYFCFSRTFLEEDLQRLEEAKPAAAAAVPPPSDSLSAINASSLHALPKGAAVAMVETDINEEDLLHLEEAKEDEEVHFFAAFFEARRTTHRMESATCPVTGGDTPFPVLSLNSDSGNTVRRPPFTGRHVLRQLPAESIEKSALEVLRLFWRSGVRQRKAVLAKYATAKRGRSSFIQRMCLEQAERVVTDDTSE